MGGEGGFYVGGDGFLGWRLGIGIGGYGGRSGI